MDEAIQDRVGKSGVWNAFVPVADGDLSSDEGGRTAIAVIDDFEQVFGLRAGKGIAQPIIQNEQVEAGERAQQLGIRAIGLGESEGLEQAGSAHIADIEFGFTGGAPQGTGEISFSGPGGAENQGVEMALDPIGLGEFQDLGPFDAHVRVRGRGPGGWPAVGSGRL